MRVRLKDWTTPESLSLLEGWARDGLVDDQIAENIGCSRSTLYKWKKESKDFSDALKKGKEVVDRQVENALLKRALGYEYTEEVVTNAGTVVELLKHERPDVTAIIYWLRNRKRGTWNNQDEIDIKKKELEVKRLEQELVIDEDITVSGFTFDRGAADEKRS